MRPDGAPDPDDYGLPRVDVVIPDDARELDGDVLAYHREERRRRRRERLARLGRPLTRFGVAIPIIAGALLVALVSGMLMTVFGPRPGPRPSPARLAPLPSAGPGRIGGLLPDGHVDAVAGERTRTLLRSLRPGVIAVVPPAYRCRRVVAELAARTRERRLHFWLVADPRPAAGGRAPVGIKDLRACAGTAHDGTPRLLDDPRALLATAYAGTAPRHLTAVLVRADGVVTAVLQDPRVGPELTRQIAVLRSG
ncbi:hypothetical protein [Spirillospora albida]|uniref:hypothetical protein n=1 Tax=Spirillospora albida TaxID=58123 RepID=UPI0004BF5306|nr:hypothetical protein [Spirillospora albida]